VTDITAPKAPRRVYTVAGIYGLIVLLPLYFTAHKLALSGPALTRPEYYYGFLGAACTFQLVYLTIGRDPVRYRPLMPVSVIAKLSFFVPVAILFAAGRIDTTTMALSSVDGLIALAFLWAWRITPAA
jgi:hypothetical protein